METFYEFKNEISMCFIDFIQPCDSQCDRPKRICNTKQITFDNCPYCPDNTLSSTLFDSTGQSYNKYTSLLRNGITEK